MNIYFDLQGCQTLLLKEGEPLLFSLGSWTIGKLVNKAHCLWLSDMFNVKHTAGGIVFINTISSSVIIGKILKKNGKNKALFRLRVTPITGGKIAK